MSVKLITEAFYLDGLSPAEKLTLVALADHANDETRIAHPSIGHLAKKTSQSERTVQRVLRRLVIMGLIKCDFKKGRATVYHVVLGGDNLSPRQNVGGDAGVTGGVTQLCHQGGDTAVTLTIKEPSREPSKSISATPKGELACILSEETASAVVEHRKRIRRPLTAEAARRLARELGKCADPEAAANEMLLRGWQGFKAEWMENGAKERGKGRGQERFDRRMRFARSIEERRASEPDLAHGTGDGAAVPLLPARSVG